MRKTRIIQIRDRFPLRGKHHRKNRTSFHNLKKKEVFFQIVFIIDLMNLFEEAVWFLIFGL